jgi:dTDP-glucose pyrophosphorylase/CBS domain-containing protein
MEKALIDNISVSLMSSVLDAFKCIDKSAKLGICLVTNEQKQLIAVITDGDIRRAILKGFNLDASIQDILHLKQGGPHPTPVTAPIGIDRTELLRLIEQESVRQVPLVNTLGQVEDIVLSKDLVTSSELPLQALIMAGGFGQRLMPLTAKIPKPMLTIGEKPLLEHIVLQLKKAGVKEIGISTHYKSEIIKNYFVDGSSFGVGIEYFHEEKPMGTAGVLGLMPVPKYPLLIINGDILSNVDFHSAVIHHQRTKASMTIGVRLYSFRVPYGVITCDGEIVHGLEEKPKYNFLINAGIYLVEPAVFRYLPRGSAFNMTDLIQWLLDANEKVISYPIVEYWQDIGKHSDYEQAQTDYREGVFGHELE